jgi:hypothetical protein
MKSLSGAQPLLLEASVNGCVRLRHAEAVRLDVSFRYRLRKEKRARASILTQINTFGEELSGHAAVSYSLMMACSCYIQ